MITDEGPENVLVGTPDVVLTPEKAPVPVVEAPPKPLSPLESLQNRIDGLLHPEKKADASKTPEVTAEKEAEKTTETLAEDLKKDTIDSAKKADDNARTAHRGIGGTIRDALNYITEKDAEIRGYTPENRGFLKEWQDIDRIMKAGALAVVADMITVSGGFGTDTVTDTLLGWGLNLAIKMSGGKNLVNVYDYGISMALNLVPGLDFVVNPITIAALRELLQKIPILGAYVEKYLDPEHKAAKVAKGPVQFISDKIRNIRLS